MSGGKTLKLRGGRDDANDISEEENNFQDLGTTKRSDNQEYLTPNQCLNRWTRTSDKPNFIRRSRSLSSLDDVVKTTSKSRAVKPIAVEPAIDLVGGSRR